MNENSVEQAAEPGSTKRTVLACVAAMAVMIAAVAVIVVVVAGASGTDTKVSAASAHGAVAPLDLSTIPDSMASHYRYAEAHMTEYQQIPCWCGCQQFLGHRNLADCFVRADGQGWEAHAAGCGVCTAEAVMAEETLDRGGTAADVKTAVDTQFGETAITTPSAT